MLQVNQANVNTRTVSLSSMCNRNQMIVRLKGVGRTLIPKAECCTLMDSPYVYVISPHQDYGPYGFAQPQWFTADKMFIGSVPKKVPVPGID